MINPDYIQSSDLCKNPEIALVVNKLRILVDEDLCKNINKEETQTEDHKNYRNNKNIKKQKKKKFGKKGDKNTDHNKFQEICIKNFDLTIRKGEFIGIICDINYKNISLIQTMINNLVNGYGGEQITKNLNKVQDIILYGSLAYNDCSAWMQNQSIKDNILYFKEFEKKKYQDIIKILFLENEIDLLTEKDATIIDLDEPENNYSERLKAKIAIARALYADKDIYFFDNPLVHFDMTIRRKLLNNCFKEHLTKKTRILSINDLSDISCLKFFDRIIWVKGQEVIFQGSSIELEKFSLYYSLKNGSRMQNNEKSKEIYNLPYLNDKKTEDSSERSKMDSTKINSLIINRNVNALDDKTSLDCHKTSMHELESHKLKFPINHPKFVKLIDYFGGKAILVAILTGMFLWQVLKIYFDIFLINLGLVTNITLKEKMMNLFIFILISLASSSFMFLSLYLICKEILNFSKKLYKDMIDSLKKASLNIFYYMTPISEINRTIYNDVETLDESYFHICNLLFRFFSCLGVLLLSLICEKYSFTFILVLGFISHLKYKNFINNKTKSDILLNYSNTRIPKMIAEIQSGYKYIRILNAENNYKERFYRIIDEKSALLTFSNGIISSFSLLNDQIHLLLILLFLLLMLVRIENYDIRFTGLLLMYLLKFRIDYYVFISNLENCKNIIASISRCLNYTNLPKEKEILIDMNDNKSKSNDKKNMVNNKETKYSNNKINNSKNSPATQIKHPKKVKNIKISGGEIEFKNYSAQYRSQFSLCLNKINIKIKSGEKIGIIGKHDSGKYSIADSIFRVLEPIEGTIIINGADIKSIDLQNLRKNFAIIQGNREIFIDTVKNNIEPLGEFSQKNCEEVLKLLDFDFIEHANGVARIIETQDNLSVGQKQILQFARAILRVYCFNLLFYICKFIYNENFFYIIFNRKVKLLSMKKL